MSNISSILSQISMLSADEQRQLNKELVAMLNRNNKMKSMQAAQQFKITDKVIFDAKTKGLIKIEVTGYSRDGSCLTGVQIGGMRAGCEWKVAASLCSLA